MNEEKTETKPIVVFPINANPPHMGHLSAINMLLSVSSKLVILLYDKMQVCSAEQAKIAFESIFKHYIDRDKIEILISSINFATISELPKSLSSKEIPFTIATTSKHIYVNLKSKGYPYLTLINKPFGWRDEFYTVAYMRSIILGQIENAKLTRKTEKYIKGL